MERFTLSFRSWNGRLLWDAPPAGTSGCRRACNLKTSRPRLVLRLRAALSRPPGLLTRPRVQPGQLRRALPPGRAHLHGDLVESRVNRVIGRRLAKKQPMRWSRRGAHLLVQIRVAVRGRALAAPLPTPVTRVSARWRRRQPPPPKTARRFVPLSPTGRLRRRNAFSRTIQPGRPGSGSRFSNSR